MYGIIRQRWTVYFTGIVISILLSCWASIREVVINSDAICYLLSAESMSMGLGYAAHLCDQAHWPFYSALIFTVASVTKISYIHSAYLLDGLFSLISITSFIAIVQFLKNSPRTLWITAAVILLAHEFNSVREYIIRDHGFWAFYLLSILFLLNFFRAQLWRFAFAWNACLIIASLFRVEGIIFLVLIPFSTVFLTKYQLRAFLKLNTITIVVIAAFSTWFLFHSQEHHLGRLGELKFQLLHGISTITQGFHARSQVLAQQILSQYSAHDASLTLFLVLMMMYFINVIGNISLLYAILVVYAWMKKSLRFEKPMQWVLWSYVIVNVVVTILFLAENMFLSKRYLIALSLTLMIWVPFAVDSIYLKLQNHRKKSVFVRLGFIFLVLILLSQLVDFGYSKKYMHDAGQWLSENVPTTATLYSNDYQVMFYSQHFGNEIFTKSKEFAMPDSIVNGKWQQYDYLALRLNKKELVVNGVNVSEFGRPVQVFANKRGDEVIIYRVH